MASILVVDDEPDIRYLTQVNLELDGHRVMTAANGREALAAVQVELPDVVLLDVVMPDVDGWAVLETIKAHLDKRVATVRVVLMTSLATDIDRLRGGIEGAVRYLVKPVSPEDLRLAVLDVLGGDPEPQQRRDAQTDALSELARIEKGVDETPDQPRPRLSRYERTRPCPVPVDEPEPTRQINAVLTDKQRQLMETLAATPSVSAAASQLGVSRSNVYASLRRVARKLDVESVPDLLQRVRAGTIVLDDE